MTRTEGKFGTNHTFAQIIYIIHCDSKLHFFLFFYCKRCCCLLRRIAAVGTKKPKKSQTDGSFYRPQTKFEKVMFLHVSVILSTGQVCLLPGGGIWSRGLPAPGGCLLPGRVPAPRGVACSQGGVWWRPPQDSYCCGR